MILQDQSKNYMRPKSFMLHKLGLDCFRAALALPQQFQNTDPHPAPYPPPPEIGNTYRLGNTYHHMHF
jgi:hypothetical protein